MKGRIKSLFALAVALLIILNTGVAGAQEKQAGSSLDCLYPVHLRHDLFYDGRLTGENIAYLKSIPHAEALSVLNVLRGSGGDLMLGRYAERVEGAAMLVRLLGVEEYALNSNNPHPFTDVPDWANPYVGYLYQNGFAKGIGNNEYGSAQYIDEKSYLTFLLRALGYSDKNGRDFTWDTVYSTALKAGLLEPGEEASTGRLIKRERMSQLSWRAMFLNHKVYGKLLLICLYEQGKISRENLEKLFSKSNRLIDKWYANIPALKEAFLRHDGKIELSLEQKQKDNGYRKYLEYVLERVQLDTGVFLRGYSIELWQKGTSYTLIIYPDYENTAAGDEKLRKLAGKIVSDIISPDMTDYEKVKTVHDYLVTRLEYDAGQPSEIARSSFSALGALETGVAVCDAYSKLTALLLNRAGVPCRIVVGLGNGTSHAWNMVCIDGELYHIDVTWDDPVSSRADKKIRYDYFNLSDAEIQRDHSWDRNSYPACTFMNQNYFVKNNLIVKDPDDIKAIITEAVENRRTDVMLKYIGESQIDIRKIVRDVNSNAGYVISRYVYSVNEAARVIRLESIEYVK